MTASAIERGRFFCPACPQRFQTLHDKKVHLRAEHAGTSKRDPKGERGSSDLTMAASIALVVLVIIGLTLAQLTFDREIWQKQGNCYDRIVEHRYLTRDSYITTVRYCEVSNDG